jgi:branched-subunit amino acid transport protein
VGELWAWLAVLTGAVVTYASRGLGVALSGRLDPGGALIRWVEAVAYALLAGLIARMVVLPLGPLQQTPLASRLAAAAIAVAVFLLTRHNLLFGTAAGVAALILLSAGLS